MGLLSAVVGGVTGLLGAGAQASATNKANEANQKINERNLQFAANATQIRAKDMRAAGINPILAADKGGGASAPSQISMQAPDVSSIGNSASNVMNAFTNQEKNKIAESQVLLQTANSAADVEKKRAEVAEAAARVKLMEQQGATQAAAALLSADQAGLARAGTSGKLIDNALQQTLLDFVRTDEGRAFWNTKHTQPTGIVGQAASLGGLIKQLFSGAGPMSNSGKGSAAAAKVQAEIDNGSRKVLSNNRLFRLTKQE